VFTVAKAKVLLSVGDLYQGTYDGLTHSATVLATGVGGEDLSSLLSCTYNGIAGAPVNVGSYQVTATFAGNDNYEALSCTSAMVTIHRTVISATATSLAATEGAAFSGAVVSFTDTNPNAKASDFAAVVIDWGDGSTSAGSVRADGSGGFEVVGSHTYRHFGKYTPVVMLRDITGQSDPVTASGVVNVGDAALHVVAPTPLIANQGKFVETLLAFTDDNPFAVYTDYTVGVDWGDGTRSTGYVIADPFKAGQFDVIAYHNYATGKIKSYTATVTVSDGGPSPLIVPRAVALR
jgi:hypothetical protein